MSRIQAALWALAYLGMSNAEVAEAIGATPPQVSQWRRGAVEPSEPVVRYVEALASVVGRPKGAAPSVRKMMPRSSTVVERVRRRRD